MGIRVHKMIGYGLTDLKCENFEYVDDRINPNGFLGLKYDEEREEIYSRDKYVNYLTEISHEFSEWKEDSRKLCEEGRSKEIAFDGNWDGMEACLERVPENWNLYDSIRHDYEYGLPNVLCIIPASYSKEWSRYDNVIDYIEETEKYKGNRVETLRRGIHPYDYTFMDSRTGKKYEKGEFDLVRAFNGLTTLIRDVESGESSLREGFTLEMIQGKANAIAEKLNFVDYKEADKFIAPVIPEVIKYICRFGKIFNDDSVINQLRPILYVNWG